MDRSIISLSFGFLAAFLGIYSLFIAARIILTWFSHMRNTGFVLFLSRITDPYLNWWRDRFRLQLGMLDISPIIAIAALSVMQTLCVEIANQGRISISIILVIGILALRSVISFIIGFCLVILVLRFIAFKASANIYSPFWQVIDSISRPLLYRINRIFFGKRIVKYTTGIITAIIVLSLLWVGIHFTVMALVSLASRIPL